MLQLIEVAVKTVVLRIKRYLFDYRLRSILLMSMSICCALSLASYHQYDASWNTSNNISHINNILGSFGACVADLLFQCFGLSSLLLVLALCIWSIVLWTKGHISFYPLRVISLLSSMVLSSFCLSIMNIQMIPAGLGGAIGLLYGHYITDIHDLLFIIAACSLFVFFMLSTGYDKNDFNRLISRLSYISNKEVPLSSNNTYPSEAVEVKNTPKLLTHISQDKIQAHTPSIKQSTSKPVIENSSNFDLPTIDLLGQYAAQHVEPTPKEELAKNAEDLLQVLSDFGVKGRILEINQGPVVTLYEFEPSAGTKSSRIIGLADDIARSLSATSTRIAVIPGRNALGIELPNKKREFFSLRDLVHAKEYTSAGFSLPIILGKDLAGKPAVVDLAKMPHLLVAGTTGSGKSVAINAMIISLLYQHSPESCKFIMIDPKMLELSVYDGIPHLLTPVVTEPGKAVVALKWAVKEMENRYRLMSNLGVRNIAGYNERITEARAKGQQIERTAQTGFDPETGKPIYESVPMEMDNLPFIVIIVDEMADLMIVAGKDIESSIQRLAQMARAAGIHIIMATQRPSVDVITGVIKANFPSRISFKVTSKIDSRTIMGEQGAEQLLGMGDMLYMGSNSKIARFHGPFVDDKEVENIAQFLKAQASPEYINGITESEESEDGNIADMMIESGTDDESLYRQALQIVQRDRKVSTSYVQRCLRIGYNRAALIIERMEREGAVSQPNHAGKREILLPEN